MSDTPQRGSDDDRGSAAPPTWAELLGEEGARERDTAPVTTVPVTRRELREQEATRASSRSTGEQAAFGFADEGPKRRRRRWLPWVLTPLIALLVVGGGGAAAAFLIVPDWPDRLQTWLAGPEALDYTGAGEGEVTVYIREGDIGSDIAVTLQQEGVTKTYEAFYNLLLAQPEQPVFQPGVYQLRERMSAQAALDALLDPANRLENQVLLREGESVGTALEAISLATEIPVEELQAAAADHASYGVPAEAPSLEGFLFPATYTFDPGTTAQQALQIMVDRMMQSLDGLGVAPEDRLRVVTLASIVQREAGPNPEDLPKIARVFQNRLDQGMHLESDATVTYGTGNYHSVWTTDAERADASNPYNTYANPGLPIGPIGAPGDAALHAALNPADGDWLFFVVVNLQTSETVFSTNADDHEAAAQRLRDWCNASEANNAYCN